MRPADRADRLERLKTVVRPMMQGRPDDHVEVCLAALRLYRHLADDSQAIELAPWPHEAVYDPARDDNERRSAELGDWLLTVLGYPPVFVRRVHDLVLAPGTTASRTRPTAG